jgi:hypothetical protein
MVWREPEKRLTDCYSCTVPPIQKGITKKKKCTVEYPNIPPAIHPVPHCEGLPIPEPSPDSFSLHCDEEEENTLKETPQPSTSRGPEFFLNVTSAEPHKLTQKELSDLIRDLKQNCCVQDFNNGTFWMTL